MWCSSIREDFAIATRHIWDLWKTRKALGEDIMRDLLRSREQPALQAIEKLQQFLTKERHQDQIQEIERVNRMLRERQCRFRDHPLVNQFLAQYVPQNYGVKARFRFLLLIGPSVQGKTSKGMSLFPPRTNAEGVLWSLW